MELSATESAEKGKTVVFKSVGSGQPIHVTVEGHTTKNIPAEKTWWVLIKKKKEDTKSGG